MEKTWGPERLKALRTTLSQTQTEFAELVGVSLDTIKKWETSAPIPRMASNLLDRLEKEAAGKSPQPA